MGSIYDFTDEQIVKEREEVYIGIENAYAPIRKIIGNLKKAGWNKIISYAELIDIYPDWIKSYLYLETKKTFQNRLKNFEEVRTILQEKAVDRKSMDLFDALMKFRAEKDYNILPELDKDIYFPQELRSWCETPVCFVDCGAFNGDTLLSMAEKFDKIETYIALEPDKYNFSALKEIQCKNIDKLLVYPYAAWNTSEKLMFCEEGMEGSYISENGTVSVDGMSLDELLADREISHIKMDIEGAEMNALLGAEKIIKKYKPKLAISVYHKPEDIYEIPLLLEKWNLGYRYCLRAYADMGTDCVLYAIV